MTDPAKTPILASTADAPFLSTSEKVEALFLARQLGFRIVEMPVTCVYHAGSSVNRVGDVLNMLGDVLAVRWRHRR